MSEAFGGLSIWVVILCISAAFVAGYVDAIAGGGGLIQLPVLLFALPTTALATVMGTNKFSAIFGTAAAAVKYNKEMPIDRKVAFPMMIAAGVGSAVGALCTIWIERSVLEPIVILVLISVALFTLLRPALGREEIATRRTHSRFVPALIGGVIGFYDGLIGPGTGTFLVFAIVALLGHSFLRASGIAKVVNVMTNLAALIIFIPSGHVVIGLAITMAIANLSGGLIGARAALARGSTFVRAVFLAVIALLLVRLAFA